MESWHVWVYRINDRTKITEVSQSELPPYASSERLVLVGHYNVKAWGPADAVARAVLGEATNLSARLGAM